LNQSYKGMLPQPPSQKLTFLCMYAGHPYKFLSKQLMENMVYKRRQKEFGNWKKLISCLEIMENMTKDFTLLKTSLVSLSYLSRLTLLKRRDLSLVSMRKCHLL
jgi:hypothetical protein